MAKADYNNWRGKASFTDWTGVSIIPKGSGAL